MILLCYIMCAYVYKICEGTFCGCDNRSFSWLYEKVKIAQCPAPGFFQSTISVQTSSFKSRRRSVN